MPLLEVVISPRHMVVPMLLVLLYMGGCVLTSVTTGVYYQNHIGAVSEPVVNAHLSFCVVGFVVYFFFSALFWLWSAKYAHTQADRNWRLFVGIWGVSLLKDLPLFIIESIAMGQTGWWSNGLQSATYIVQIIFFAISITVTGMSYAWYVAGFFERTWSAQLMLEVSPKGRKVLDYPVRLDMDYAEDGMSPPVMLQEARGGHPEYLRYGSGGESPRPTAPRNPYTDNYEEYNSPFPPAMQQTVDASIFRNPGGRRGRQSPVMRDTITPPAII